MERIFWENGLGGGFRTNFRPFPTISRFFPQKNPGNFFLSAFFRERNFPKSTNCTIGSKNTRFPPFPPAYAHSTVRTGRVFHRKSRRRRLNVAKIPQIRPFSGRRAKSFAQGGCGNSGKPKVFSTTRYRGRRGVFPLFDVGSEKRNKSRKIIRKELYFFAVLQQNLRKQ